jgi:hypothetical protein
MAHTYDELQTKTIAQLREIAAEIEHEAVKGYTQLNKEHLLEALCQALNIDKQEQHEVVGIDKTKIKAKIRELKKKRNEALAEGDHKNLKLCRRQIHRLNRKIRKALT